MTKQIKSCKYHIVWIPKYRKSFLKGEIKKYVEYAIEKKCNELKIELVKMQVMPDHIHLFISIPVDISISYSIQHLKGFSAFYTRKRLPNLKKYKSLWCHGYFCESIGHISEKTIKLYIDNQWKNYKLKNSSPH